MAKQIARRLAMAALLAGVACATAFPAEAQVSTEELDALPALELPTLSPDTLAFGQSFSLGVSSLNFSLYNQLPSAPSSLEDVVGGGGSANRQITGDSAGAGSNLVTRANPQVNDRISLNADLSLNYLRYVERERLAWVMLAGAAATPNLLHIFGDGADATTFDMTVGPTAAGELRFYPMGEQNRLFILAGGIGVDAFSVQYASNGGGGSSNTDWNNVFYLNVGGGVGYGRLLNVSPASRLNKIERYLTSRGYLDAPIPKDIGNEILLHWYALRNEIGYYKHLVYTLKVLKKAGLLSKPLDYRATYALQQMIRDAQMAERSQGWLVAGMIDMTTVVTKQSGSDANDTKWLGISLVSKYGKLLSEDNPLTVSGILHYDPGVMDSPFGWMVLAVQPAYTLYFYNEYLDPTGSLKLGAKLQTGTALEYGGEVFLYQAFSDMVSMPVREDEISLEFGVNATYTRQLDRGSAWFAGANAGLLKYPGYDDLGYYLLIRFGYTYGVAEGYFSRF